MIREALDDAGPDVGDVDGVCYGGMPPGIAEYLGIHPRFVDGTMTGGSSYEVHVEHAAAAIAAGLCEVVVGVYAATPRGDRARGGQAGRPNVPRPEPDARVGDALRPAHADGRVRPRRQPAHGRLRHDVRAARPDRGRHAPVGGAEPAGALPGPDHHRRRARVADAGVAAAPARLLPRDRRRRRVRDDVGRAGATCPSRRSTCSARPRAPTTR